MRVWLAAAAMTMTMSAAMAGAQALPYYPQPTGLYYSNDGTGNKGTWVPCTATCFAGGGGTPAANPAGGANNYAPIANPTFTGTATAPNFVGGGAGLTGITPGQVGAQTPIAPSANLNTANGQFQVDSLTSSQAYGLVTYGDSLTAGLGATTAYATLIASDIGTIGYNYGNSGDTSGDMTYRVFSNQNPGDSGNPIVTMMIGTNDQLITGVSAIPSYTAQYGAAVAWGAISSTDKIGATTAAMTLTGSWAGDTTFAKVVGAASSTAGNTSSYSAVVGPSGVFYLWYKKTAAAGAFTETIDGTLATDTISGGSTINVAWTADPQTNTSAAVGLARYVTTPGTHTLVGTVSSGSVTFLALGFPPLKRYRGSSAPRVNMGIPPPQGGLQNNAAILQFDAAAISLSKLLVSDGLNTPLVDTYNALDANLDFLSTAKQTTRRERRRPYIQSIRATAFRSGFRVCHQRALCDYIHGAEQPGQC